MDDVNKRDLLTKAQKKKFYSSLEDATSGNWGLLRCLPKFECVFCERYYDTSYFRQFRNLYVSGIHSGTLIRLLDRESDVAGVDLDNHAFRNSWHTRKTQFGRMDISHDLVLQVILSRLVATQGHASPNSADKMISLLTEVTGMRKQTQVNNTNVNVTWETVVAQRSKNSKEDTVITLGDGDFFNDDDVVEGGGFENEAD